MAKRRVVRGGPIPNVQKALIAEVVESQEITPGKIQALSTVTGRSEVAVKRAIQTARENFLNKAEHYVTTHQQAVDKALDDGDPKALEVAVRGSQWALEHMSLEGERIIEKDTKGPAGVQVFVGLKFGGMKESNGDTE